MVMKVQEFIKTNGNWEEVLQLPPYCLKITRDHMFGRSLVMFKYNQIESDFNNEIVRECRGLILDENTFEVVSHAFDKFGNYGESYCPEIDWKSCYVTEKVDGSICKFVKMDNGGVLVSTNGTIDAFKANLQDQIGCPVENFGELALLAIKNQFNELNSDGGMVDDIEWFKSLLDEGYTYIFELTSKYNKIVVQYGEPRLTLIGCRNNKTNQETFFGTHPLSKVFQTPKMFPLYSVNDCIEAASKLDSNNEGYVVVDKDFNRIKIKSPLYVQLHHLRGEGPLTYSRVIEVIRNNELDEVLQYFPEFKPTFDEVIGKITSLTESLETSWKKFTEIEEKNLWVDGSRKEKAIWIQKEFKIPGCGFSLLDKKSPSVKDWIEGLPVKSVLNALGYRD